MSFVFLFLSRCSVLLLKRRLPCNPVFKDSPMKGLELARAYYEVCAPLLQERIPDVMAQAAVGLVGEGSECFGCDDDISRDHDWGPAFCLWVPRAVGVAALPRIEEAFAALPAAFEGFPSRMDKTRRMGRVGPLSIEKFYGFFLGTENMPATWQDWLAIPEYNLAACTNGAVFADALGEFSRRRALLLDYYPQDVHLQKLASCCMRMAQAGQYNLPRCLARGEAGAAMLAAARFGEAALSMVYLLNRRYMPFYKWAVRLAADLPVLGAEVAALLTALAAHPLRGPEDADVAEPVEAFCAQVARILQQRGYSPLDEPWLWAHGPHILRHVQNEELRRRDLLKG